MLNDNLITVTLEDSVRAFKDNLLFRNNEDIQEKTRNLLGEHYRNLITHCHISSLYVYDVHAQNKIPDSEFQTKLRHRYYISYCQYTFTICRAPGLKTLGLYDQVPPAIHQEMLVEFLQTQTNIAREVAKYHIHNFYLRIAIEIAYLVQELLNKNIKYPTCAHYSAVSFVSLYHIFKSHKCLPPMYICYLDFGDPRSEGFLNHEFLAIYPYRIETTSSHFRQAGYNIPGESIIVEPMFDYFPRTVNHNSRGINLYNNVEKRIPQKFANLTEIPINEENADVKTAYGKMYNLGKLLLKKAGLSAKL
jgi:hypothetical protein